MKFLSRKSPEQKLLEKLEKLKLPSIKINFFVEFSKFDQELVLKTVNDWLKNNPVKGRFVGSKGWYLFNAEEKLQQLWIKLQKGVVNLEEISKEWDEFGKKRVYLLLEDYAKEKKVKSPVFIRKGNLLFLRSQLEQVWIDAINSFELDDLISFDKIIEAAKINSNHKNVLREFVLELLNSETSDMVLGKDNIVRWRKSIRNYIGKEINQTFEKEDGDTSIHYEDLAEQFGITTKEVGKLILNLIVEKDIENITNYPLDELIKKK